MKPRSLIAVAAVVAAVALPFAARGRTLRACMRCAVFNDPLHEFAGACSTEAQKRRADHYCRDWVVVDCGKPARQFVGRILIRAGSRSS